MRYYLTLTLFLYARYCSDISVAIMPIRIGSTIRAEEEGLIWDDKRLAKDLITQEGVKSVEVRNSGMLPDCSENLSGYTMNEKSERECFRND